MKKILDILIIVLLTVLVVNFFQKNEGDQKNINKVVTDITKSSYTIPASVGLKILNYTQLPLLFNTCDNVEINLAGKIIPIKDSFCRDIIVEAWATELVDYASEYDTFLETGSYVMTLTLWENEHIQTFDIENKGAFSKIFTEVFYAPIYNLMIFLIKSLGGVMWWAIIVITIIIRLVLLYPQHKMMMSQKKLQALQPKIKALQEKYKWNQQALGKEMMDLYKKEQVNPMGSCGFLLIQMPILLVIYNIIRSIQDPSHYYYIYSFLSGFDISSISYDFFWLNLIASGWVAGIILGVSVATIQFFQVKLSLADKKKSEAKWIVLEKKKDATGYSQFMPDPDMMNKFMLYGMPAMVWVFTYSLFAGVGIYWGMSTLFMLIQQSVVNKILQK